MSNILLSEKKNKLNNFFPQSMESLEFENNPSITIVKNFELIINYIKDKQLKLSENRLFLQPKDLFQLNLQLLNPIEIDIQKPQPSSLPHVNAIFWLLRTTKMVKILRIKNNLFMEINHDILNEWITLNKTEQYCTLLDAESIKFIDLF